MPETTPEVKYTVAPGQVYQSVAVIALIFKEFKLKQTASDPVRTFYLDRLGRTWIAQGNSLMLLE